MPKELLEWLSDNAVTFWRDGKPVTTGHGDGTGRASALHDLFTTLRDRGETEAATWVEERQKRLTEDAKRKGGA